MVSKGCEGEGRGWSRMPACLVLMGKIPVLCKATSCIHASQFMNSWLFRHDMLFMAFIASLIEEVRHGGRQ